MRVVLDTNVLISAFNFPGGPPEGVYRLPLEGRIELVTSPPLLAELARVLIEKFEWDSTHAQEALRQVATFAEVARSAEKVRVVREDPTDDRVLEAAAAGDAHVIVSGDRHLLKLGSWRGKRIEKAADFLESFE